MQKVFVGANNHLKINYFKGLTQSVEYDVRLKLFKAFNRILQVQA